MADSNDKAFTRLTPRERDVMDAIVSTDGTNASVSEYLGIAPSTVAVHIQTIMLKTDLHSRVALAVGWVREAAA